MKRIKNFLTDRLYDILEWSVRNQKIPDYALAAMKSPLLPEQIALIAESKVGLRESGAANTGTDLQPFFDADSYDPNGPKPGDDGYAWCAAFVCYCVLVALRRTSTLETTTFRRPTTPSAWGFIAWSLAQDKTTSTKLNPGGDILRGDLVIYKFSHIGIATGTPNAHGTFTTVEGNTNSQGSREGDGVYQKVRATSQVKSRIRFTI